MATDIHDPDRDPVDVLAEEFADHRYAASPRTVDHEPRTPMPPPLGEFADETK